jgi:arylsulfatase A-like enzyme
MRWKVLFELWVRLACFACVLAVLAAALASAESIDGWVMFETGREVLREIVARVFAGMGLAVLVASGATLLIAPYVVWRPDAAVGRARLEAVSRTAAAITVIVGACGLTGASIRWASAVGLLHLSNSGGIHLWDCLAMLECVVGVLWYSRRTKRAELSRLSASLSGRFTRRALLLSAAGGVLSGLAGEDSRSPSAELRGGDPPRHTTPNLVLVTFDALSAEDVSCYGYRLPTTPHIDAFAQSSYVFRNCYATCTFTTPSIVSMMTGRYPSSTRVYHYGGPLHGRAALRTLPGQLRAGGYRTAASVANPGAHPRCLGFGADFDVLPAPPLNDLVTREAAQLSQSAVFADDAQRAAHFVPYMLEEISPRTFGTIHSSFPPQMSFQQAERILAELRGPFFLWVHVFAPHFPYLPEPPYLHRFLRDDELRTHADFTNMAGLTGLMYPLAKQAVVDKARLRYDEWIAQADGAFGSFMAALRSSGRLNNTAVIVSADHGESFEGGWMGHGGAQQLRPIIHVPLVMHLPRQSERRDITAVVDHTALAPTILDLAGLTRPEWMDGQSVTPLMRGKGASAGGLAFTQFFVPNSVFEPVRYGTVGAIDGQYQYVFDLEKGSGGLFQLSDACQGLERSRAEPQVAAELHARMRQRFPSLFSRTA